MKNGCVQKLLVIILILIPHLNDLTRVRLPVDMLISQVILINLCDQIKYHRDQSSP